MLFTIQRFLEDTFERRGLADPDQYAVSVANLYDQRRFTQSRSSFLTTMHGLRTSFFRANTELDRSSFERDLVTLLDRRFQKKSLAVL